MKLMRTSRHALRAPAAARPAAPAAAPRPRRAAAAAAAAAAAGAAPADPYAALGLPSGADYNAVQRAYRKRVAEAKAAGDEAAAAAAEAAHSTLMMSALTSRLAGGGAGVDKEVRYADRARYFPWRPRFWPADRQLMAYAGAAQALFLAWALATPGTAGTQPVVWSAIAGAAANVVKQNRVNPVPPAAEGEKRGGGGNILRGAFLAVLATFAGCMLFYTLPDALAATYNRVLPFWFYESQSTLLAVGSCLCNWLFSAFFR
jgi:DNA polymerase delta subunit 1